MAILAFDWGGTNIKFGVWQNDTLLEQDLFPTPDSLEKLEKQLLSIKNELEKNYHFEGVAISAPGAVNYDTGVIEGISAIPYIHHFDIRSRLSELFQLPVKIENDANAAGIAEVWQGVAKGLSNVLFIVIGTGIGGAILQNGKVNVGAHRFGGEFGLMYMDQENTFSAVGTGVKMAQRYADRKGLPIDSISAKEVFDLAAQGDTLAQEEENKFYDYLAQGLFSLQFCFDPECLVLGGGVSAKEGLAEEITKRVQLLMDQHNLKDFKPDIRVCQFKNDANLIGAVASYYQQME